MIEKAGHGRVEEQFGAGEVLGSKVRNLGV